MVYNLEYIPSGGKLYTCEAAEVYGITVEDLDNKVIICVNGHKYPRIMGIKCPLCEQYEYEKVIHKCKNDHNLIAVGPGEDAPSCRICKIEKITGVNGDFAICSCGHRRRQDLQRKRKYNGKYRSIEVCPNCRYEKMCPEDKMILTRCEKGHLWPALIQDISKECPICRIEKHLVKECIYCKNGHKLPGCFDLKSDCPLCRKARLTPELKYGYCSEGHKYPLIEQNKSTVCPVCKLKTKCKNIKPMKNDSFRIFDTDRNGDIKSEMLSNFSNYYVWWKCSKNHHWVSSVHNHSKCPYCTKQLACEGETDLATTNPEVKKYWCKDYNGELDPSFLMSTSKIYYYLTCEKKHIYCYRGGKRGCPFCSNSLPIPRETDLFSAYPELESMYDKILNGNMESIHLLRGCSYYFWLKCPQGHHWINNANAFSAKGKTIECPYCKMIDSRSDNYDRLIKEWDSKLNGDVSLDILSGQSDYRGVWKCEEGHKWVASVSDRSKYGCPYCSNKVVEYEKSLAYLDRKLASEYHPLLNGDLTAEQLSICSNQKVWWICENKHVWKASVNNRLTNGCPFCAGELPSKERNLKISNPEKAMLLFIEWMGDVKAENILPSSNRKVWLKCSNKNHIYINSINQLNYHNSDSCPYCGNKIPVIGENDLKTMFPKIAADWNYEKNIDTPESYTYGSGIYKWWNCSKCGNTYRASIANRTANGEGCPCNKIL